MSVRSTANRLAQVLPERVRMSLFPSAFGYGWADIPDPVTPPAAEIRLYIAPVNFAAQGYAWARAAETLPGVAAVNSTLRRAGGYGFATDRSIDERMYWRSDRWGTRELGAVANGFTHVIFEAEKPAFGRACDFNVVREIARLTEEGVATAFASHGTDLRLPSRHRQIDKWSPFADLKDPWVEEREVLAVANRRKIAQTASPVFVSTPDLLLDWPEATWLPVVVRPEQWRVAVGPLLGDHPLQVTHAPTNRRVKGSDLIEEPLERLQRDGAIEYHSVSGVASGAMAAVYANSDVVIEQFRIGTYSAVAIEAMAAGRLVVAHVHEQVRDVVLQTTGRELPVVEATPDTLEDVLHDIAERRDHYRSIAARGLEFVMDVHSGPFSGRALAPFLGAFPAPRNQS